MVTIETDLFLYNDNSLWKLFLTERESKKKTMVFVVLTAVLA